MNYGLILVCVKACIKASRGAGSGSTCMRHHSERVHNKEAARDTSQTQRETQRKRHREKELLQVGETERCWRWERAELQVGERPAKGHALEPGKGLAW